jgi:hypothetical protein
MCPILADISDAIQKCLQQNIVMERYKAITINQVEKHYFCSIIYQTKRIDYLCNRVI